MKNGYSSARGFYPIEWIILVYALLTGIYILIFFGKVINPLDLLTVRVGMVAYLLLASQADKWLRSPKRMWFVRNLFPIACIMYFYPETYYLKNCIFANDLDPVFIHLDQVLFGCQPSMEFSRVMPYTWFNELMNFGYFSYYLFIAGVPLVFYFINKTLAQQGTFILLCSFFVYYLLFVLIPVVGPQFYYTGAEAKIPDAGIFRELIKFFQSMGEKPTGAFPSSHVGICTICMFLYFCNTRKLFWLLFPISLILFASTVYIKAHYLIDVFAGWISAVPIYYFSKACWRWLSCACSAQRAKVVEI